MGMVETDPIRRISRIQITSITTVSLLIGPSFVFFCDESDFALLKSSCQNISFNVMWMYAYYDEG